MKRVYISGKIGEEVISEATRRKFARAEEMLRAKGYDVFNPTDERWQAPLRRDYEKDKLSPGSLILQGPFPTFYAYALLRDLMVLSTKDAVYMLADWRRSEGARTEYHFALATGKKILFQVEDHAFDRLKGEFFVKSDTGQLDEHLMKAPWNEALNQYIHDNINEVWLPL